ncbi:MAG: hypothetical protein LC768_11130 [Acidobacteria bacterium]|nr:hypothetical protein [Acidobacteriota bacterium]MCA1638865.1 hypothetical protein [Acidobacteriota bacterium]
MSEPREPRKAIAPDKWGKFLKEFSDRNKNRRARFDVFFSSGETLEEAQEGHLESVSLNKNGNKTQVIVTRIDTSEDNAEKMTDAIENVRGITVQYETDGSENALEITDVKNTLLSLRLESKLDGNS